MIANSDATPVLRLHGVAVVNTLPRRFRSRPAARNHGRKSRMGRTAATVLCGNATSVIACDVEAAIERELPAEETPDGRPGSPSACALRSRSTTARQGPASARRPVRAHFPTTACYNGIFDCPKEKRIRVGGNIRYFGDGFQTLEKLGDRRLWRIPVMDGEFLCEDIFRTVTGVAGVTYSSAARMLPWRCEPPKRRGGYSQGTDVALRSRGNRSLGKQSRLQVCQAQG